LPLAGVLNLTYVCIDHVSGSFLKGKAIQHCWGESQESENVLMELTGAALDVEGENNCHDNSNAND
jgi:hypothetical protein